MFFYFVTVDIECKTIFISVKQIDTSLYPSKTALPPPMVSIDFSSQQNLHL